MEKELIKFLTMQVEALQKQNKKLGKQNEKLQQILKEQKSPEKIDAIPKLKN